MVELDAVRTANNALVQRQPLVAVFFGGTGGIGSFALRALCRIEAQNAGRGLRAYIIGRKPHMADEIISECRKIFPKGEFKFVKAEDMALIKEVDRVCAEILQAEEQHGDDGRIDYLMMCQGGVPYVPRKDTKEGLDTTMALMYYSRMRIVTNLIPLLLKSPLPATVVSVFAGGMERAFYPEDLSLRKNFKYDHARSHMCYMHCLFFEALAAQHPGKLTLIHIFPGLVIGPNFKSPELPLWFRVVFNYIVLPLFGRFITIKPEESGQRMISLAAGRHPPASRLEDVKGNVGQPGFITGTDGKPGSGVYSLTWSGESNYKPEKYQEFDKDKMRKKVYEHTTTAFRVIEEGGVFTE